MSLYLIQAAYTSESWKHQVQTVDNAGEKAKDRIGSLAESVGGHVVGAFYAFGEYDLVILAELPNEEAAAAFALAANAGGSLKSIKSTPLLTMEQGVNAMKKAAEAGKQYRAPIHQGAVRETVTR